MFSKFKIITNGKNDKYYNQFKYYYHEENALSIHKSNLKEKLDQYINYNTGIIDGDKIEKEWFKEIKADIFLSHSHADKELAISIAGWLEKEMGLTAFVDSCVWGYVNELLDKLNNKYNVLFDKYNNSKVYDYSKALYTASHVYLMLNSALNNMINKTECFMFIDTPNSRISMDMDNATNETLSPWIYSEVVMVNTMQIVSPSRPIKIEKYDGIFHMATESVNIKHKLDFSDFVNINLSDFIKWKNLEKHDEHPLDTLYKMKGELKILNG